jgi:hypothetical protein
VLIQGSSDPPRLVRVGIDAAIVAQHEVCIRATDAEGRVRTDRFHVQPTLAGLRSLTDRLAQMPGVIAVAEPTSMTWLGLSVALAEAGCDLSLLGARHAARLRGAISGKHKSDVIDADVLARAGEVFDLHPLRPVEPAQLALRRACVRRGGSVIDGNPVSAAVDQPGPVGVSGRVERVPRFAADRGCGTAPLAASGPVGGRAPFHADRGGGVAYPRRC